MCSINKPGDSSYLCPNIKCPPPPWKKSPLVIGKTEQRAAGAGREHRQGLRLAEVQLQKAAWKGPSGLCSWSRRPWEGHAGCRSPGFYSYWELKCAGALGETAFQVLGSSGPGRAGPEERGAPKPISSLAPICLPIIYHYGGEGEPQERAAGSEDSPRRTAQPR